jgi:hypothetical protein
VIAACAEANPRTLVFGTGRRGAPGLIDTRAPTHYRFRSR